MKKVTKSLETSFETILFHDKICTFVPSTVTLPWAMQLLWPWVWTFGLKVLNSYTWHSINKVCFFKKYVNIHVYHFFPINSTRERIPSQIVEVIYSLFPFIRILNGLKSPTKQLMSRSWIFRRPLWSLHRILSG